MLFVTADSRAEKPARAALLTAVQRQLGQNTILILDGMNYIKGWRYQLYCAARELKIRTCTVRFALELGDTPANMTTQVHVVATPEQCREWNASRGDGQAYVLETCVHSALCAKLT
jgi:protein KTI12